jgi:beta-galactosidase
MSRQSIPCNHHWKYTANFCEDYLSPRYDDTAWPTITIPHTNIETPYNYFDETMSQFVSCYRNTFTPDMTWQGQYVFLDFEGVMTAADVYLNGEWVGSHQGGYTQFSVNLTGKLRFGKPNTLAVKVDSRERADIPPFGGFIDYLTFGGIYRDVTLRIVDPVFIENVCVRPQNILQEDKRVAYTLFVTNTRVTPQKVRLTATIKDGDTVIAETEEQLTLPGETTGTYDFVMNDIKSVKLWDLDRPNLYTFEAYIATDDQRSADTFTTRFGFRTAEFTPTGFLLNNVPLKLRGLDRHQTFPYVGQAMPARAQRKDVEILKYELHLNIVRTSHYPQSKHFLDRCDEIGLLVLEEIPGWQHLGDEAWKKVACDNVREMITRDWNHPAIVLWGVRINESPDDHDFYTATNRIAHELDVTRQTGGIRNFPHSELLEDVYTMNDFSHSGGDLVLRDQQVVTGLDRLVPYLITEFNGHMYPTKRFDQEERLVEQALRHARVQSRAGIDQTISGAIGWCAFDYNTHYQFGSGDRICYHGVMDMFRMPKMAASFYKSQVAPEQEVVLEPATLWTRGERSIGGVLPLTVFTNCDEIECYFGDLSVGRFTPDTKTYPGLQYPPVTVMLESIGAWGCAWEDGRIIGYLNGNAAIEKRFVKNPLPTQLIAAADDTVLQADGIDVTRIVFQVVDQAGNILPYLSDVLKLTLTGPGKIIGPQEMPLIGGCIAVWVKTQMTAGVITLSAASTRLRSNVVTIGVKK